MENERDEMEEREKKKIEEITKTLFSELEEQIDQMIAEETYKVRAKSALTIEEEFEEIQRMVEENEIEEDDNQTQEEMELGSVLNGNTVVIFANFLFQTQSRALNFADLISFTITHTFRFNMLAFTVS